MEPQSKADKPLVFGVIFFFHFFLRSYILSMGTFIALEDFEVQCWGGVKSLRRGQKSKGRKSISI